MKRIAIWALLACFTGTLYALEAPSGPVILTVTGEISEHNTGDQKAEFDLAMLQQLPAHEISTHNPWEEGLHHYVGFHPKDLLELTRGQGSYLRFIASNQYITEIPITDFTQWDAVVAYKMDGKPIAVRNKGPLMVVFNFDKHPELENEVYYGRSIWQIKTLQILEQ